MRKLPLITITIFFILLLVQCMQDQPKEESAATEETKFLIPESGKAELYTWYSEWDSASKRIVFRKGSKLDSINKEPESLVNVLNMHEQIDISLEDIHGDTIIIEVNNAQVLTEQSGTAGAREYMGMVVYTLTEAEGINYVEMKFEEGSHAIPGVYARQSLKDTPMRQGRTEMIKTLNSPVKLQTYRNYSFSHSLCSNYQTSTK